MVTGNTILGNGVAYTKCLHKSTREQGSNLHVYKQVSNRVIFAPQGIVGNVWGYF